MTDERDGFPVLRRDVAGIDVGSEEHWVCAPSRTGDGRDVERFPATTPGLERLIAWLQDRRVRAVALERTGVYWIVPHEMLEQAEFEVGWSIRGSCAGCRAGRNRTDATVNGCNGCSAADCCAGRS